MNEVGRGEVGDNKYKKNRDYYKKVMEGWYSADGGYNSDTMSESNRYLADKLMRELSDLDKLMTARGVSQNKSINILDIGAGAQVFERYFFDKLGETYKRWRIFNNKISRKIVMVPLDIIEVNKVLIPEERSAYTVQGDITEGPFKDDTFEIIISNATISILPAREFLTEIYRILKPGGVVLFHFYPFDKIISELKLSDSLAKGNIEEIKERFVNYGFIKVELEEEVTRENQWLKLRAEKPLSQK
jgi:SAM-dependent methyltransferase